jgi:hypothetical protein
MVDHLPGKIIVMSGDRKRRWSVYVGFGKILSAVELYFDQSDGVWKPVMTVEHPEGASGPLKH